MSTQIVKAEKTGRMRYAESERRELVNKYRGSGMTRAAFCRANGVTAVTERHQTLKALLKDLGETNWLLAREGVELKDYGTL